MHAQHLGRLMHGRAALQRLPQAFLLHGKKDVLQGLAVLVDQARGIPLLFGRVCRLRSAGGRFL